MVNKLVTVQMTNRMFVPCFMNENVMDTRPYHVIEKELLFKTVKLGYTLNVSSLLRTLGISIDTTLDGRTALMEAVIHKHILIVQMLVSHRANVHIKDMEGFTALDYAMASNFTEAISVLTNVSRN